MEKTVLTITIEMEATTQKALQQTAGLLHLVADKVGRETLDEINGSAVFCSNARALLAVDTWRQ